MNSEGPHEVTTAKLASKRGKDEKSTPYGTHLLAIDNRHYVPPLTGLWIRTAHASTLTPTFINSVANPQLIHKATGKEAKGYGNNKEQPDPGL